VVECSDIAASITRVTTQRRTLVVDDDQLVALRRPHDGVMLEAARGIDEFELAEGPFLDYTRTLQVEPAPATPGAENMHTVTEVTTWTLGVPIFWVLFWFPFWLHVRKGRRVRSPWWAPAGRLDERAARIIGLLGVLAIVNGYLGTVIGQTLTFVADDFCAAFETASTGLQTCVDPAHDKSARANVFTIARVAIVLSLALTIAADRYGRKHAVTVAVTASCVATALGALAPSMGFVTASQIVARGLATGVSILIAVIAAEELPPKSRAYGVSMLILLAGLGSGMVVWVLPAADVANWGWRIVYGLAILLLPFAVWAAVQLPTTRRFAASVHTSTKNSLRQLSSSPVLRRRLALLGIGAMCATVFATPASQFDNQFLRDELGFSASRISLFTVVTSTPIGIGVLAGGMLADRVGRRPIGAIGIVIGTSMTLLSFFSAGLMIWFVRGIGVVLGAGLAVPALAVYGPELFPTRLRSTANGAIIAFGVVGSVVGLQLVGRLAERWDAFGPALAVVAVGPLILTVLIITLYPETANKTLEEINDEPELESA
jgi:MFS family permease